MDYDTKTSDRLSGPVYPAWDNLNKFRKMADKAGGVAKLSPDVADAYHAALTANINRDNRAKCAFGLYSAPRSNSASGTFANNGDDVLAAIDNLCRRENDAAIKRQKDARLKTCNWRSEYDAAMGETRNRKAISGTHATS